MEGLKPVPSYTGIKTEVSDPSDFFAGVGRG
jgi:hypothetical protein